MRISIKKFSKMIPSIVFGTSMIGTIPLALQANAWDISTMGAPIVQENLSTYITITSLGQFETDPTGANALQRVYLLNQIRLITSEVNVTVAAPSKTVTFDAKANSRFYTGSKTLPYTLPVNYSLEESYGEIATTTFDYPGFPSNDTIFAYLRENAAHPDQIDEGQLAMSITGEGDVYTASITPQPWATWYDSGDKYSWDFTVKDSRVDIETVLTPGSDITSDTNPFIGTPTPVQIINMIFDPAYSWASDLYSKDFLAVSNIQVTSKSGTATISGQGFLYGTTNVTFDVQSAPTLAELVTTTNVTPTPNNWYNPSEAAVLGSMFNLNPINQTSYPGLQWDSSQLSFASFSIDRAQGTATVVANADSTSYVPGSSVSITFTVNQSIDINDLFVAQDQRLVTFESDPTTLDAEQQIYLIQIVLQNFNVVTPAQQVNYEKFVTDEFNSSCVSVTWQTAYPFSFTITLNQTAVEFNGSATFYYGLY